MHIHLVSTVVGDVPAPVETAGLGDIPVVAGGIIPATDADELLKRGVARIYTPKNCDLNGIVADIVEIVAKASRRAA